MNLARYTRQEANALEEYYLRGYQAEGLVGKGKVPANDNAKRRTFSLTPAGIARVKQAEEAKETAFNLVAQGHDTVRAVTEIMQCTETPVRRYFRLLEQEGRLKPINDKPGMTVKWRVSL